jgi:membrane dipeptidase
MNQLGMLVDVSHVSEPTFFDAIEVSTKPIIASHSCVRAINPSHRNLSDEQLLAIKHNGGVVFLNFYSGFIDKDYQKRSDAFRKNHQNEVDSLEASGVGYYSIGSWLALRYPEEAEAIRPDLDILIEHLTYMRNLIGIEHIGIGADYDGMESTPKGLDDVSSYPVLTEALLKKGYSKEDLEKLYGLNFLRVLDAQKN